MLYIRTGGKASERTEVHTYSKRSRRKKKSLMFVRLQSQVSFPRGGGGGGGANQPSNPILLGKVHGAVSPPPPSHPGFASRNSTRRRPPRCHLSAAAGRTWSILSPPSTYTPLGKKGGGGRESGSEEEEEEG